MHRSEDGQIMTDALICVLLCANICLCCIELYRMVLSYEEGYRKYQERTNAFYERAFSALPDCQACLIDGSD